jgi:hypothetical protein
MSADEVTVTIVFLIPSSGDVYRTLEFSNITINTNAPFPKIKQAILDSFPEVQISNPADVQMMIQASDGTPKTGAQIRDNDRIVIMPTYTGPIVKRPTKP